MVAIIIMAFLDSLFFKSHTEVDMDAKDTFNTVLMGGGGSEGVGLTMSPLSKLSDGHMASSYYIPSTLE